MKKSRIFIALIALCCLMLVFSSCNVGGPEPNISLLNPGSSDYNTEILKIANVYWNIDHKLLNGDYGFNGITIDFENPTDKTVMIVWEKSSFVFDGQSYPLFITGQKYSQSNEPMPPSAIPPKSFITKTIFASSQVTWKKKLISIFGSSEYTWDTNPVYSANHEIILIMCAQSGDKEDFYTVQIKGEPL